MRFLSLFSGIGAMDLGLTWAGWTPVGQVEIDPYCRAVLAKHWPDLPRWEDVRELRADDVLAACGRPGAIVGGFPCQPHSVAGKRRGQADERHLWPEYMRLVRELRPHVVLGENVPGLRTTAADEVFGDLEGAGYACGAFVVGADDVGAPHRRKRVWIVALRLGVGLADTNSAGRGRVGCGGLYDRERAAPWNDVDGCGAWPVGSPTGQGLERLRPHTGQPPQSEPGHAGDSDLAYTQGGGRTQQGDGRQRGSWTGRDGARWPADPILGRGWPARPGEQRHAWEAPRLAWATQPGVGGATDGPAGWVARRSAGRLRRAQLKALGNAVVPQVVAEVGRAILAEIALT